ncbi:hypothetical protein [Bradyrhizobium iriomotense]|uniref:hypothetical protein n=1 Tax=Bradyrhizobium iriomotense TaxID=441950 RepID=UPI0024E0D6AA|nr:hypothetical protein [Bradyrhizobium iriomotense]
MVFPEEARARARIFKGRIIEVATDGRIASVVHGVPVLRILPEIGFALMAAAAGLTADKGRLGGLTLFNRDVVRSVEPRQRTSHQDKQ